MENFFAIIFFIVVFYSLFYFVLWARGDFTHKEIIEGLIKYTIALPFAGIFLAVFTLPMLLFGLWLIDKFSLGDISSYFLLVFFLLLSIPLGVPFALFGASAILYFWNKEKYLENLSNQQNTKLNKWLYKKLTK